MLRNFTRYPILFSLLLFCVNLNAEEITGTVYDQDYKVPLIGVNVTVVGTTVGTVTDLDGKFSIEIDESNRTLRFAYVGYIDQEKIIGDERKVEIFLSGAPVVLEEVVVVGVPTPAESQDVMFSIQEIQSIAPGVSSPREQAPRAGSELFKRRALPLIRPKVVPTEREPYNTEGYATVHENGFKKVGQNPLSTFSVDVDGASYSNVRRFLNNGNPPQKDAVRIEEMINYFSYDYEEPTGEDPFSINTELATCPWNKNNLLLHLGLQGEKIPVDQLPPSNIVFLIDVSGSMQSPNKLPLLKSSIKLLVDNLREEDRVAMVVYAGQAGLVLPSTSGKEKKIILDALNQLNAGGSTAGGAGLKLAYEVAAENFIEDGNNRILLATDGDFNVGVSSNSEMERLVEQERERGTAISVLGFGMGNYKDDKMEIIANKGNGNYSYIDNLLEAKKVLVTEFGGTFQTIAKDVKFQVEFNPKYVAEYRLVGYENRLLNEEDFDDDKKDAGEIGSGHNVTALYEIVLAKEKKHKANDLKYQTSTLSPEAKRSNDLITLKLRYKQPNGKQSKLIEQVVKNSPTPVEQTSNDFRFSAAVASFGMLLRDSQFLEDASWESTVELAQYSKGDDLQGYRGEMLRLMELAELLSKSVASKK